MTPTRSSRVSSAAASDEWTITAAAAPAAPPAKARRETVQRPGAVSAASIPWVIVITSRPETTAIRGSAATARGPVLPGLTGSEQDA